jgi:hypothetical protein
MTMDIAEVSLKRRVTKELHPGIAGCPAFERSMPMLESRLTEVNPC